MESTAKCGAITPPFSRQFPAHVAMKNEETDAYYVGRRAKDARRKALLGTWVLARRETLKGLWDLVAAELVQLLEQGKRTDLHKALLKSALGM